jgi:hypothetical protein
MPGMTITTYKIIHAQQIRPLLMGRVRHLAAAVNAVCGVGLARVMCRPLLWSRANDFHQDSGLPDPDNVTVSHLDTFVNPL